MYKISDSPAEKWERCRSINFPSYLVQGQKRGTKSFCHFWSSAWSLSNRRRNQRRWNYRWFRSGVRGTVKHDNLLVSWPSCERRCHHSQGDEGIIKERIWKVIWTRCVFMEQIKCSDVWCLWENISFVHLHKFTCQKGRIQTERSAGVGEKKKRIRYWSKSVLSLTKIINIQNKVQL